MMFFYLVLMHGQRRFRGLGISEGNRWSRLLLFGTSSGMANIYTQGLVHERRSPQKGSCYYGIEVSMPLGLF
jgi:hypothetical protein